MEVSGCCKSIMNLEKYYKSPHLSDVTLFAGDSSTGIPCHRIVLELVSDYFETLFNSSFIEKEKKEITLRNFTYYWLDKFIQFIYCSTIRFRYDEFADVLNYSNFLQIRKVQYKYDNPNMRECVEELLKVYGHNELFELAKLHELDGYEGYIIADVLLNYDESMLRTLDSCIIKEILPLMPIFNYNVNLESECINQKLNIVVRNGKCFSSTPTMYAIASNADLRDSRYDMSIHRLDKVKKVNVLPTNILITSTIIRNGVTTVTVNYTKHDPLLLRAAEFIDKENYTLPTRIYSPNENICFITQHGRGSSYGSIKSFIVYNGLTFNPVSYSSMFGDNGSAVYVAFSQSNIYFITLFLGIDSVRLVYFMVKTDNCNNKKRISVQLINARRCCSIRCCNVRDTRYAVNLLYTIINNSDVCSGKSSIAVINTETNQLLHMIDMPTVPDTTLLAFGNNVYYGVKTQFIVDNRLFTIQEIQNGRLTSYVGTCRVMWLADIFVMVGSYQSDDISRSSIKMVKER